jgi:hypothetical protein
MAAKKSTLTLLCAAVAAYYKGEGDRTKAGVVLACLDHDPDHFYASVARYPGGPYDKNIVISTHRSETKHTTAEEAVDELALKWYKLVKPPPTKDTLEALAAHLARGE